MLVGVFGVPSQLYAGTLTVDGGGCFLHGGKGKKKPVPPCDDTGKPKQNTHRKCMEFHSQLEILPVSEL